VQQHSKIAAIAVFLLGPWLFRQHTTISIIALRFSMGLKRAQEGRAGRERKKRKRERKQGGKGKAPGNGVW
jgi:hypothetical protein